MSGSEGCKIEKMGGCMTVHRNQLGSAQGKGYFLMELQCTRIANSKELEVIFFFKAKSLLF